MWWQSVHWKSVMRLTASWTASLQCLDLGKRKEFTTNYLNSMPDGTGVTIKTHYSPLKQKASFHKVT